MKILLITAALLLSACNSQTQDALPIDNTVTVDCFAVGNTCTKAEKVAQRKAEKQLN